MCNDAKLDPLQFFFSKIWTFTRKVSSQVDIFKIIYWRWTFRENLSAEKGCLRYYFLNGW